MIKHRKYSEEVKLAPQGKSAMDSQHRTLYCAACIGASRAPSTANPACTTGNKSLAKDKSNCSSQNCPSYLWPKGNHFLCYRWVSCSETSYKENYTLYAQKDSFTFIYKAGCIHWIYREMQFSLLGSPILQSRVPRALMLLGRPGYRWSSSQQPEYQGPTQTPWAYCVRARVPCCLQGVSHSWF